MRCAEIITSRKHVASADVVGEQAAKQTRSPRPSVASLVPSSPVADVAERAGQSKERTSPCAPMGLVPMPGSQPEEALPAVGVVEQSVRTEEQTCVRTTRDL